MGRESTLGPLRVRFSRWETRRIKGGALTITIQEATGKAMGVYSGNQ